MKILFNFIKKPKFKMSLILSILIFLYTTICAISYANTTLTNISNNVFRLHIIANSNSKEDQTLKYQVRDSLLEYMNTICTNCKTKEEAITIASEHINEFKEIATNKIHEEGFNYNVTIEIGNFKFPTKEYGDITLPSGYYDALKVEIGESKGKNWWCVMFPSLCFVDISSGIVPDDSKNELQNNLSEEEYSLISESDNNNIKLKFKLLEIFANYGLITAKN